MTEAAAPVVGGAVLPPSPISDGVGVSPWLTPVRIALILWAAMSLIAIIVNWQAIGALDLLDVDRQGFDVMDRRLLLTIIEKFAGGPVGVDSLAAAIGEERGTIEDVVEPFLIQQGYLARTARGRIATPAAYRHFGLRAPEMPSAGPGLFADEP